MRLLIDTVTVGSPGGQALQTELPASVVQQCPEGSDIVMLRAPDAPHVASSELLRVETVDRPLGWAGMRQWFHRALPAHVERLKADVVYSSTGILSRRVCTLAGTINLINNMLPYTRRHIRHHRVLSMNWMRLMLLQRLYTTSCRVADAVITHSHYGMKMVRHYAGDVSAKAFVAVNPIPEFARFCEANPPSHPYDAKPFLFYLSVVYHYKNQLGLIEAYRRARERGHDLPDLLIAGPSADDPYLRRMEQAIEDGNFSGKVRYLGKIPRDDIPRYLHHATINMFPSTCETSSFVQAEILGMHGVMACSTTEPMPEVSGGAAELFDTEDPDSIAEVMVRLCGDDVRRAELRRKAAEVAARMNRTVCGDVTWQAARHARQSFNRRH